MEDLTLENLLKIADKLDAEDFLVGLYLIHKNHENKTEAFMKEFNSVMEGFQVIFELLGYVVRGGRTTSRNSSWWMYGPEPDHLPIARFFVEYYSEEITVKILEDNLNNLDSLIHPDFIQFNFKRESTYKDREPGKEAMITTLSSIDELKQLLQAISKRLQNGRCEDNQ